MPRLTRAKLDYNVTAEAARISRVGFFAVPHFSTHCSRATSFTQRSTRAALLAPLPRSHPILTYEEVTTGSNFAAGPLASDHPVSSRKLNLKNSAHVHLRTPTIHAHSVAVMLLRRPQPSIVVTVAGHRGGIETLPMAFESESVRVALS